MLLSISFTFCSVPSNPLGSVLLRKGYGWGSAAGAARQLPLGSIRALC